MQKKLPTINNAHGPETRNIINEIIKAINDRGLEILSESAFLNWLDENGVKHLGEWDDTKEYVRLSVVLHKGTSYTSKRYAPVGVDILNEDYWAVTGNYNVQVENYRQDVVRVEGLLNDVRTQMDTMVVNAPQYTGANDNETLQSAINNSEGKTLKLEDNKTYIIDSELTGVSNIKIIGNSTVIKVKDDARIESIIDFTNKHDIHIEGVTFDMNMQNMPIYVSSEYSKDYNISVKLYNTTGIKKIINCKFINLYNYSIKVYGGNHSLIIRDNIFNSPAQNQNQKATHIHLLTINKDNKITIENNAMENDDYSTVDNGVCGVFLAGVKAKTTINDNKMNNVGRNNTGSHRLLPIDLYGDCRNITISNNTITNAKYGFVRIHNCKKINIFNNTIYYTGIDNLPEPMIWIVNGDEYASSANCEDIFVDNNIIHGGANSRIIEGIHIWTIDWSQPLRNIKISNNSFYGRISIAIVLSYCYDGVMIEGNKCHLFEGYKPGYLLKVARTPQAKIGLIPEKDTVSSNLKIINNNWVNDQGGILLERGDYTGDVETIFITNNNLKGIVGYHGIRTTDLKTMISNNHFNTYSAGVRIDGNAPVNILNNIMENTTLKIFKDNATNINNVNNYQDGELII